MTAIVFYAYWIAQFSANEHFSITFCSTIKMLCICYWFSICMTICRCQTKISVCLYNIGKHCDTGISFESKCALIHYGSNTVNAQYECPTHINAYTTTKYLRVSVWCCDYVCVFEIVSLCVHASNIIVDMCYPLAYDYHNTMHNFLDASMQPITIG